MAEHRDKANVVFTRLLFSLYLCSLSHRLGFQYNNKSLSQIVVRAIGDTVGDTVAMVPCEKYVFSKHSENS